MRRLVVVLVAGASLVAACSGGGDGAADDTTVTSSATTEEASADSAPDATTAPAATTTTTTPTTTTTEPPIPVPLGVRWTDAATPLHVSRAPTVRQPFVVAIDGEVWTFGDELNTTFASRSADAGVTWTSVQLAPPPADGALTVEGLIGRPGGGFLAWGVRRSRCLASIDRGDGYRETSICRRARPVVYTSDDGTTWQLVDPPAMAPPGDTSIVLADVVAHGGGFVAAGTVRGPDWFARLWTSPDGVEWTAVRDLRLDGVAESAVSAQALVSDGEQLALATAEHHCVDINDNTPGWILGTGWTEYGRLLVGADALGLTPVDDHPLYREFAPPDCAVDSGFMLDQTVPTSTFTLGVVGGDLIVHEIPNAVLAVEQVAVDGDEEVDPDTGGVRRFARLGDDGWRLIEVDGVAPLTRTRFGPTLLDADGELLVWEAVSIDDVLVEPRPLLPDGAGGLVPVNAERPIVAGATGDAALVDGTLVTVGTLRTDPFVGSVPPDMGMAYVAWTSTPADGPPPVSCDLEPGGRCRQVVLADVVDPPDLSGARLAGVDLTAGDLADVDLTGADLTGARLWSVEGGVLDGANLTSAEVQDATLASAVGAVFAGANLARATVFDASGADFAGADLRSALLYTVDGANLVGARFDGTTLEFTRPPDLTGVALAGARLRLVPPDGEPLEWSLAGLDLTDVTVDGGFDQRLVITDLAGAVLADTEFRNVDLTRLDAATIDLDGFVADGDSLCPDGLPPDADFRGSCRR